MIIALRPDTSHNCCPEVLFMPILMLALIALGAFVTVHFELHFVDVLQVLWLFCVDTYQSLYCYQLQL